MWIFFRISGGLFNPAVTLAMVCLTNDRVETSLTLLSTGHGQIPQLRPRNSTLGRANRRLDLYILHCQGSLPHNLQRSYDAISGHQPRARSLHRSHFDGGIGVSLVQVLHVLLAFLT